MMKWTIVIAAILMVAGLAVTIGILAHSYQNPPAAAAAVSAPAENSLVIQPVKFTPPKAGVKTCRVVMHGHI